MLLSDRIGPHTRFAFVHIPKTAGSSIITVFQELLGLDSVWCHGQNFDVSQLTRDIPERVRVIGGHFPIGSVDRLLPEDFHYISIVRDPADRIVSYHRFIMATPDHPDQSYLPFREVNADLRESQAFRSNMQNQQVRFLSHDRTAAAVQQLVERGALSLATINEVASFMREICNRARIHPLEPRKVNIGQGEKPTLDADVRQLIEEVTDEDRILFNYVSSAEGRIEILGGDGPRSNGVPGKRRNPITTSVLAARSWFRGR